MKIPEIKEWESPTGWCRRLAQLYGMNETQTAVLEEVRRLAYIQGVNDILNRREQAEFASAVVPLIESAGEGTGQ